MAQIMAPYAQWDIPVIGQSYLLFRAKLVAPHSFSPGAESLEAELFEPRDIPFDKVQQLRALMSKQGNVLYACLKQQENQSHHLLRGLVC